MSHFQVKLLAFNQRQVSTVFCSIIFIIYPKPLASEEAKIPISPSQTIQFTIISIIVEILPSIPKENINFVLKNILASYLSGNPLIHCPVRGKM
jgi:hypothetical protein